jgi:PD-(D/E)XK nuclease superfamily
VGALAQQGVSEFHRNPLLFKHPHGVDRVADRVYLYYEILPIRQRVMQILDRYRRNPYLHDRDIILLNKGDEPIPAPLPLQVKDYHFHLVAAFDCIVRESDGRLHIIDFKTGQADFDRRQAYVYLLAASILYPDRAVIASFYNLETEIASETIAATPAKLTALTHKLAHIAQLHQSQLQKYRSQPQDFDRIFPPHPGSHCRYCISNYRCSYAIKS